MTLTTANLKLIQQDMVDALSVVAEKHDITIIPNGGKFGDLSGVLKFKIQVTNESGESEEELDYKTYHQLYGMKPEWLGEEMRLKGKPYTIKGLLMSRRKNVVSLADSKGKQFVVNPKAVITYMTFKGK